MEYLEGETLDDRLTRGVLPAADVLRFGVQIASALAHAHRAHIVHRDLKPGNVMLTSSGAKLLDFGLARRNEIEPTAVGSTTVSFDRGPLTEEGTIVGTFQYMAPEQLHGKEADERTDVFAFGTLLFEMATGRKAFDARTQTGLIASILKRAATGGVGSARWRGIASSARPPRRTVYRQGPRRPLADCTRPRARARMGRELGVFADAYVGPPVLATTFTHVVERDYPGGRSRHRGAVRPVADVESRQRRRDTLRDYATPGALIPFGEQRTRIALSPDGRTLAFVAFNKGHLQIWVQPLDSLVPRPLEGTEGAVSPFWSPNSKYLGFFTPASGELKRIDLSGGPPRTICAAAIEGSPNGDKTTPSFSQSSAAAFSASRQTAARP
jgi:hypothetical protein